MVKVMKFTKEMGMKPSARIILFCWLLACLMPNAAVAANNPVVSSIVFDVDGKPLKGAFVFFYDSPDTKRAVDLVSPKTDASGKCVKEVPPGTYWVLARLKTDAKFDMGPLMIGDKISADPVEITLKPGDKVSLEFTVQDLIENIMQRTKKRKDLNKITGKIVNTENKPLTNVFVYANRHLMPVPVPDFFSPWNDKAGKYSIYLPKGIYYLGVKDSFTTDLKYAGGKKIIVDDNMSGVDLVLQEGGAPVVEEVITIE